ncbi:MAG TPA: ATP-binding protein [Xenococcaceae cyanobacterium]
MSKVSVLWVSKKPAILSQGVALCDRQSYSFLTAKTAIAGLKLAQQFLPQIIVSELSTSGVDGLSFLAQIRQNPDTATIPVILLSSSSFQARQQRQGMEMGADDILFAPYTELDLEKAIAARLTRQRILLKQSQQELAQLRYNITAFLPHEIKTALTGIIAGTELLLNSSIPLDPAVMRELLNCIQASGKRLSRLSHNFLLYSELKAVAYDSVKKQNLQQQTTDSAQNIITRIALKQTQRYQRQSDLTLNLQEASVKIDQTYLIKIVEELIDNACKFSQLGTPIEVNSQIQQDSLIIAISDRGRGMTAQQIAKIGLGMQFDRSIYEQQGFGLGLVIAQDLVQLHKGTLEIASIPGEITKIKLILPLAKSTVAVVTNQEKTPYFCL